MTGVGLSKQARFNRKARAEASDIGPLPAVVNPERKDACRNNLLLYLQTYFPNTTGLKPFGLDQRRAIERIQSSIIGGDRFAQAFPRGYCKTTISENSSLWATSYGHRKFIPIFGANGKLAIGNLDSIKREVESNPLLMEDFPEICYPVEALDGKPQRCAGQTIEGNPTLITWTSNKIVFPTVKGSCCSGAIITAHGITSAARGMKHKRADGTQQRPDFVIIDDPQTTESANSELQIHNRLENIKKDILRMTGHFGAIACVVNGTVIQENDLMEVLLNSPSWSSERIKMVKQFPESHLTLWLDQYATIRKNFDKSIVDDQKRAHREANEFYLAHREEMDKGAEVCWEWCYIADTGNPRQIPEYSAIQHAYNILIDDGEDVFASECQNEPLPKIVPDSEDVTKEQILKKINNLPRGTIPATCSKLTAFIDVQQKLLFWMVVAWESNFTGYIVDYGAYPDPKKEYYGLKDVRKTLQSASGLSSLEAAIFAGLESLTGDILGREWKQENGTVMAVEKCLIDFGWGEFSDTVFNFCRQSPFRAVLLPSKGKYCGPAATPLNEYRSQPGETKGNSWLVKSKSSRGIRYTLFDPNIWKTFLQQRLKSPKGERGNMTLFGTDGNKHKMLADHLTSEYRTKVESKNRVIDEWKLRPGRPDNHWLDCLVGCCVGASMLGCSLVDSVQKVRSGKKWSDMRREKQGQR